VDLRGAFEKCPFPIAILDGTWDLTWNTDKSEKMHGCFPGSKLVMFKKSSHAPFADEPEEFFKVLREFVAALPGNNGVEIAKWKEHLVARRAALENSPDTIVWRHVRDPKGWGAEASEGLAKKYGDDWPDRLTDTTAFLRTGFALYECKRYGDALKVFEKLFEKNADDTGTQAVALVWQGHMLDLLGRRDQAVERYKKALAGGISQGGQRHDQYGIIINRKWVEDRIKDPFARMENKQK
jgi:tetratricopeptide (TPR) repeat protein